MARRFVLTTDPDVPAHRFTIDYAAELNRQQHAAATAPGGPVLIIAGAGTGKTRTLVYRVAYLVETGVPPEHIVLLTFTRRASREMLARAADLLDGRCRHVEGGTFHSFCAGILRRYAPRIGFPPNFTILDASDAADVIDVLRTERGFHKPDKRFPRKKVLQALFSGAANQDTSIQQIVQARSPQFIEFLDDLIVLRQDYRRYKQEHGLMDYDDLLNQTFLLLDEHADVAGRVGAACRHVLVDEYQDTNPVQAQLVRRFSLVHGNVTAVGDDAQSIYRFRGADFRNIIGFPDVFPGTQLFKLEQNYRSTQPILSFANHLISGARRKYEKQLFSDRREGELPALIPTPDTRTESRFVAQTILSLREEGTPLSRMAVLFRNGYNSYDLEIELSRRRIPFVKYGGLKLSEAAHIKDVLAYLRVLENPRDGVAWNRLLQLLEGVGPRTARDLIGWILSESGEPFHLAERPYAPKYAEQLRALFEVLRTLSSTTLPISEELGRIIGHYDAVLKRKYFEDYPKRLQDLEHFVTLANNHGSRSAFLSSLALEPLDLTAIDAEPEHEDERPLVLSTIHSAKGLEFHSVFIIHALEGVLPSGYSLSDPDAVDEELRLFYVAVTRAETNLFISYPVTQPMRDQRSYFNLPSRFIAEVPETLLERCSVVEGPSPNGTAFPNES